MWSKLQFRMTISYLGVTVVIVLLLEFLIGLGISLILTSPLVDYVVSNTARQTAHDYALEAAVNAGGTTRQFLPGALPGLTTYCSPAATAGNSHFQCPGG